MEENRQAQGVRHSENLRPFSRIKYVRILKVGVYALMRGSNENDERTSPEQRIEIRSKSEIKTKTQLRKDEK
jgi:hypothetical protein